MITGIGFNPNASDEALVRFVLLNESSIAKTPHGDYVIKAAKEAQEKIDKGLDPYFKDDIFDIPCTKGDYGYYGFVVNYLTAKTGLRFSYYTNADTDEPYNENEDVIIFENRAPWDYTDVEKNVSYEKVKEILKDIKISIDQTDAIAPHFIIYDDENRKEL